MADGTMGTAAERNPDSGSDSGAKETAKETAKEMKDQAAHKAEDMAAEAREKGREMAREGKARARSQAEQQKDRVSESLLSVADALRRGGEELPEENRQYGRVLDAVADRAEDASHYLAERDVDSLTREVRTFARDHAPVFLSGAFTLGMLGARFLKSSPERESYDGAYGRESVGRQMSGTQSYGGETLRGPATPMESAPRGTTARPYGEKSFEGPGAYEIDEPVSRTDRGETGHA